MGYDLFPLLPCVSDVRLTAVASMCNTNALPACSAAEGVAILGPNIITASAVAPVASLTAGPNGVAIGRFGWWNEDGVVRNQRLASNDAIGLVIADLPIMSDWRRVFFDDVSETWRIRQGLPVTLLTMGIVGVRFQFSAVELERVYANVLDGSAISGYSAGAELTPWAVMNNAPLNGVANIRNQ